MSASLVAFRAGRPALVCALMALAALGLAGAILAAPLSDVLFAAAAGYDPERLVFLHATLPRLAMALLCGAALGLSGAVLQQVLRNPLASPTTLGIDAGARLALTLATLYAPALAGLGRDFVALGGSALSTLLVFALARRQGFAPLSLVLAGLVVTLYCGALAAVLTLIESRYLLSLFIWGGGSLSQQSWAPAGALAIKFGCLLPPLLLLLRPLRLLDAGEDAARSLGVSVAAIRTAAVALALALAAFVAATVGVIGFIGLVAPLIARFAGARSFESRLVWSTAVGALLLLLTDLGVQAAAGAYADLLPTGVVTAVLGSPILLWLLPRLRVPTRPPARGRPDRPLSTAKPPVLPVLGVIVAALVVSALLLGRAPDGSWAWLGPERWPDILPWRWPRVAAAASAGALLGIAGLALQRLTGNAMASPELLGVSAGAMLAAAVAILAGFANATVPSAAAGAFVVLLLIVALARGSGLAPERVLLAGISLNALIDAVVGLMSATGSPTAVALLSMLGGSTSAVTTADAWRALTLALACGTAALLGARWLAILPLGAPAARGLGVPVNGARGALLVLVAFATAAATPIVGPLSFVGLMAPRIVGLAGAVRPVESVLGSAMAGAALLLCADWLGRVIAFPFQLPAGILAALVGAPFFFWLLQRGRSTV